MKANREDLLEKLTDLYEGYRLCESHFEEKMFTSHLHTRLVATAIPTLFPSLEGSSRIMKDDHTYSAPPLFSAKIRILDDRTLIPAIAETDLGIYGIILFKTIYIVYVILYTRWTQRNGTYCKNKSKYI